jgi:hypothetical protein
LIWWIFILSGNLGNLVGFYKKEVGRDGERGERGGEREREGEKEKEREREREEGTKGRE